MAHYLPVLLVSVSTNAIPDDSSLVTLPRGQVDYLSHDWEEEDVWRSWRNMTRQKNEITNGMRLENASWRTWWKQRNKLKTVTPETLNWSVSFLLDAKGYANAAQAQRLGRYVALRTSPHCSRVDPTPQT
jgi:hypothetical protein